MANILDTVINLGPYHTFVKAVWAAGLVDTLKTGGPYTLFVPNDHAFAGITEGTLSKLMQDTDLLRKVLQNHIVSGEFTADDLTENESVTTLGGQELLIDTSEGININDGSIVQSDLKCNNGIIHIIDKVLVPSEVTSKT
jgi:uncharacterized surface protein with fasciclin (FAS1) repeats